MITILAYSLYRIRRECHGWNHGRFPDGFQRLIQTLESLQDSGKVTTLGVSEFGIIRLKAFLPHVTIRPAIDQINLRDCCDVPHDLLEYAKQEGIKLMPHMDEDNPLPKETLQGVLTELQIPETISEMRWVVKYTAVVKDRGVVENKGYSTTMTL
jgi:glutamate--cysteine ligase regulatory subunit